MQQEAQPWFGFASVNNPGAVLLENVRTQAQAEGTYWSAAVVFHETRLAIVSNSHLDMRGGLWVRNTTLMVDNTYYRSSHYPASSFILPGQGGNAAIFAEQAKVIVSRSTLIGASATTSSGQAWGAFLMTDADITVAKGCTLEAGFRAGGGRTELDSVWGGQNHIAVDPGTVLVGHLRMGDPRVTTDFSPQTGMTYQVTPTTLQVEHYVASAQSISVLGMGALVSTPWTNVVGPVFVDPAGASEYWALPPTVGPVTRTFAIPPGLPLGYQLALQCFDLQAGGTIQTSNAVVAGIRQ